MILKVAFACTLLTSGATFGLGIAQQTKAASASPAQQSEDFTLHVATREVIVNVLALDKRNHPVLDLGRSDFEVFEVVGKSQRSVRDITMLRIYDPDAPAATAIASDPGFLRTQAISCLERTTPHYQLAYLPSTEGWTSGFHEVVIRMHRGGVKLFYQHRYYVGQTDPSRAMQNASAQQLDKELWEEACNHSTVPPSISLKAAPVTTGRAEALRYAVNIDPNSLAFISLSGSARRIQLDYGACSFDIAGRPLSYVKATTDRLLTSVEYAYTLEHGFRRLFETDVPKGLAVTRFVVRDHTTGNYGSVEVLFPGIDKGPHADPAQEVLLSEAKHIAVKQTLDKSWTPPPGPTGSFGSIVANPRALCADVYELKQGTAFLPDFRELDPIGTVYANYVLVPKQLSPPACAIPGVTCHTDYFGVDYHGTFWVREPGEYEFELTSDDGSKLQIDDRQIIDVDGTHGGITQTGRISLAAGRHTIHIPYFEDGRGALMLELWVKPPGGDWRVFDMRDFAPASNE